MRLSNGLAQCGMVARAIDRRRLMGAAAGGVGWLALVGGTSAQEALGTPGATPEASPIARVGGSLVIYSGRNENLIGPVIERFSAATGVDAEVRYGGTAEIVATILEEGDNSPADIFFGQDAGAAGALAREGLLAPVADSVLARVPEAYRSRDGVWVGVSGRARVLVYNTEQRTADQLPDGVAGLTEPDWAGKVGWAPTNGSFQAFVTAFRVLRGDDAARDWLTAMRDNGVVTFEENAAITRAVAAGEIEAGLVNHYYRYEVAAEEGAELPLENHFFAGDDPGSLINVAAAARLVTASNVAQAEVFLDYLLRAEAQTYFAETTFEYPLVAGIPIDATLPPLDSMAGAGVDLSQLSDLEATLEMLAEVGLV